MNRASAGGPSVIAQGDEVSILAALRLVGVDLPPGAAEGRAVKIRCPFGDVHHADGGIEAAMRIYVDSNHVYCFASCGAFRPVALVAHAFDITRRRAAVELLERTGATIQTPFGHRAGWAQIATPPAPDRSRLAQALMTFCRRVDPEWANSQFEPVIAAHLSRCLSLLRFVDDEHSARQWLDGCKHVMRKALTSM